MSNDIFTRRTFAADDRRAITMLYSLSTLAANAPNIMIRANTVSLSVDPNIPGREYYDNDIDTFVITTSADQENTIIYTSGKDLVDLSVRDGGFF